jgi:hypothetical protein
MQWSLYQFALFRILAKIFGISSKDFIDERRVHCCLPLLLSDTIRSTKLKFLLRYAASENTVCSVFAINATHEVIEVVIISHTTIFWILAYCIAISEVAIFMLHVILCFTLHMLLSSCGCCVKLGFQVMQIVALGSGPWTCDPPSTQTILWR